MIVWSVDKRGEGPFKAYKTFGDSLKQKTPSYANDQLVTQAQSIVKFEIANATIEQLLRGGNMKQRVR